MKYIIATSFILVAIATSLLDTNSKTSVTAHATNSKPTTPIQLYKSIEKNAQGIQHYKKMVLEKNQKLKDMKVENITTTITFTKPITFETLQSYIEEHKITPKQFQARALNGDERITISFKPEAGDQGISHVVTNLKNNNMKFVGFTDIYGIVDGQNLGRLEQDPRTFLADTSADDYFTGKSGEFAHALTWLLEDVSKKEKVEGYQ